VKEWEGEVLLGTRDFEAIPTGTSTIVQLALDSYDMDTSLEIDIDGDGTVDGVVSAQTDTVISTSVVVPEDAQVDIQIEERQSGSQTTATRLSRTPQNSTPIGQVAVAPEDRPPGNVAPEDRPPGNSSPRQIRKK